MITVICHHVNWKTFKVCREDFDIWDWVLSRRPGMRLESISREVGRSDYARMLADVAAAHIEKESA